ncbi:MAG: ABC transporter ATP-binding protein [Verrucomicrobiae bacterium]|nr:ABC transporter ATP-binding protein [Verrucomicrobiae bacterium]
MKRYNDRVTAVNAVSLKLEPGEFVALHGPSGCGKSTLLMLLAGLARPDTGSVTISGNDLFSLSANNRAKLRARHIGFIFQDANLLPYSSVLENVLAATLATPRANARERATQLLSDLGLGDRLTHKPRELSAGEQQRVALARALFHEPKVLLADEPTGNLDSDNAALVLASFRTHADRGGCVLMVTHDATARMAASRAIEMKSGVIA